MAGSAYTPCRMFLAHATPSSPPFATVGAGYPQPPVPFDMKQWRKEWAAWWSRANREAIRAVIPEGK